MQTIGVGCAEVRIVQHGKFISLMYMGSNLIYVTAFTNGGVPPGEHEDERRGNRCNVELQTMEDRTILTADYFFIKL